MIQSSTQTRSLEQNGAFGERMRNYFHLENAPLLRTSSFRNQQFAATWLNSSSNYVGSAELIPPEDSYLCHFHPVGFKGQYTSPECFPVAQAFPKESMGVFTLRGGMAVHVDGPIDALSLYLPQSVIDEFTDDAGASRIDGLRCIESMIDPVLTHLCAALLSVISSTSGSSALFFDHLAHAFSAYLLQRYGGMKPRRKIPPGALSRSREQRAKELMASRIGDDASVSEIASACGLSSSYFIRAFQQSTGLTPHKWLLRLKVDRAKEMLARSSEPIAAVAVACGFTDQSHLTRTFKQLLGTTPAQWRIHS